MIDDTLICFIQGADSLHNVIEYAANIIGIPCAKKDMTPVMVFHPVQTAQHHATDNFIFLAGIELVTYMKNAAASGIHPYSGRLTLNEPPSHEGRGIM
jgi:hypothetical protein